MSAVGYGNQKFGHGISWKYADSSGVMLFLAPVSFLGLPRASGVSVYVGVSGTGTQSSSAVLAANMMILGGPMVFLAYAGYRGPRFDPNIPRPPSRPANRYEARARLADSNSHSKEIRWN